MLIAKQFISQYMVLSANLSQRLLSVAPVVLITGELETDFSIFIFLKVIDVSIQQSCLSNSRAKVKFNSIRLGN